VAAAGMAYMFTDSMRGVVSRSYRQECTPDRLLGRVSAAHATLINIPLFLGSAASTAVAARLGVGTLLPWGGRVGGGVTALGALTPVRDPARAPAMDPD